MVKMFGTVDMWVLEVGSYSATEVVAVFSTEQLANEAAKLVDGTVCGPFKVDEKTDWPKPDKGCWGFEITKHGRVDVKPVVPLGDGVFSDEELGQLKPAQYRLHEGGTDTDPYEPKHYWRIKGIVYADSEEHVAKIANELRVQVLAGAKPKEGKL